MSGHELEPELLVECAFWISEMMEEDGTLVDERLVLAVIQRERELNETAAAPLPHPEMARSLAEALDADGIRAAPDVISAPLVLEILGWEDEFLSLAGRPRPAV